MNRVSQLLAHFPRAGLIVVIDTERLLTPFLNPEQDPRVYRVFMATSLDEDRRHIDELRASALKHGAPVILYIDRLSRNTQAKGDPQGEMWGLPSWHIARVADAVVTLRQAGFAVVLKDRYRRSNRLLCWQAPAQAEQTGCASDLPLWTVRQSTNRGCRTVHAVVLHHHAQPLSIPYHTYVDRGQAVLSAKVPTVPR